MAYATKAEVARQAGVSSRTVNRWFNQELDARQERRLQETTEQVSPIIRAVCQRFELTEEQLLGTSQAPGVVYARHVAMYLTRELIDAHVFMIGKLFGGRDYVAMRAAVMRINRLVVDDRWTCRLVADLQAGLAFVGSLH